MPAPLVIGAVVFLTLRAMLALIDADRADELTRWP